MDRSWINARRTSDEYENGVEEFLEFAKRNVLNSNGKFYCPCVNCLNERRLKVEEIREHVLCDGFCKSYTRWIWHGEILDIPSVSQEKRKKGQEIEAKTFHPHILSHGEPKKLKQRQEASQLDPSIVVPQSPLTHHEKWKRARQKKSGEYTTEETCIVAEKNDDLVEQSSQGSFMLVGQEDILTTVIGRPDHPGRVCTAGRGVGTQKYFREPSRFSPSSGTFKMERLEAIKEVVKQEIRQNLKQELTSLGFSQRGTNLQPPRSHIHMSIKGSCAPKDVLEEDLHDRDNYELYVEDPLRVVATGSVFNLGPTIHHKEIEDDKVRVVVKRIRDANARVPVPTEEVQTVGQTPNHFILWPRSLVKLVSIKESAKPEADPLSCLCTLAMNIGKEPIQLKLDPDVIGKPNEIPFYISQRDILDLIMRNEMICISVLQLWLMYLHHLCISKGIIDMYGFIDPLHIQRMGNKADNIYSYIHSRICGFRNECYLAPCFHLAHWQLMIICPRQNRIIFLCSLGLKPKDKFKNLVDLAMDACHVLEGSSTSKKKATWIFPNSPRQIGSWECGYYVMRHMLNIISTSIANSWKEVITTTDPFSREEIDDIRRRWATYLLEVAKK